MDFASFVMFVQFVFSFSLLFILLPSLVIRFEAGDDGLYDRLFIPLIHTSVFVITAVHLLVALKLFETLSILGVCILGFVYLWKRKFAADFHAYSVRFITGVFDELESTRSLKQRLLHVVTILRHAAVALKKQLIQLVVKQFIPVVLILGTVGYAAYVRFGHSLIHYYFGAADPYYHMEWTKFVMKNKLFVDGVYSYGFECIMAALARLYFFDLYNVVRFIGPVAGLLIVLSIGYAVRKLGSNLYGVFFAMFLYTFLGLFPANTWRQLSALPMEYAAIFVLPGVAFWVLFCRHGSKKHLFLAAECFMLTILLHPFATIISAMSYAGTGLWYIRPLWRRRDFWNAVIYIGAGGMLGLLPMAIGLAAGISFYGDSMQYIQKNIKAGGEQAGLLLQKLAAWFTPGNEMVYAALAGILFLCCVLFVVRRKRLTGQAVGFLPFLLLTVVYFFMYEANVFGLPIIMSLDRMGMFFSPFAAMTGGIAVLAAGRVLDHGFKRAYFSGALSVMLAVGILFSDKAVYSKSQNAEWPPVGSQYQYDDSIKAYLQIRDHFEAGNWTIVSPVEEYPMVEAFGYHFDLWEFVQDVQPGSKEDFGFPTANVFFYLETVPLVEDDQSHQVNDKPIQPSDALKPFPGPASGDATTFYYRTPNRIVLEAKLNQWLQWYMKAHPDQLSIYMDTPKFKVYHLTQHAQVPPVVLPKLPENFTVGW